MKTTVKNLSFGTIVIKIGLKTLTQDGKEAG